MFISFLTVVSTLVLGISSLVCAAPVQPVEFIAFAPTIMTPTYGTIWVTGTEQNVTWSTLNVPAEIQNSSVVILLGYFSQDSENLDYKHPLASQVPIMSGFAQITVPSNATNGDNYTVVVLGDSGDASPPFTITSSSNLLAGLGL